MNRAKQTVVDCSTCELSFFSLYSCLATTWLVRGVLQSRRDAEKKERQVQVLSSLARCQRCRGMMNISAASRSCFSHHHGGCARIVCVKCLALISQLTYILYAAYTQQVGQLHGICFSDEMSGAFTSEASGTKPPVSRAQLRPASECIFV